ncbi:glycosyl hydrolase family 18 protein [Tumebacillus flagellatus]|uniref:Uncharacterized protein n=1 Tax=Tumebacillus flagellatus TaxID=1157490 RepID=A0A074LMY3_9BACL|nr:glycosyl hydrolase family 18 protein [Tumebacillus flagellatus]KEO83476.1 hypothetical protein EL26_09675 [Tumebacillus flagellatus]
MGVISTTQLHYVIVREGDTLASIAKRYQTTATTIARLNQLALDTVLTPGRILQVPKVKPPAAPPVKSLPAQRPRIPRYTFAAYTSSEGVYPGSERALAKTGADGLSGIFPLWFQVAPEEPWRLQSYAGEAQIESVLQSARERGVQVIASLTSLYYPADVQTRQVLHQAMTVYRRYLLEAIEYTYARYGLDGIWLDWMEVDETDRESFAEWVEELAKLSQLRGWTFVVNIPMIPTVLGIPATPSYDLARIGRAADLVALMLNTEHRFHTGPGALCSLSWAETGVRYALTAGVPAGKVLLGIAGYAYDWKDGSTIPEYLSFEGAMNRARQYRVNVKFDPVSQTPMFVYEDSTGTEHQVWFENTSSLSQKVTILNRYGLAGLSLWRLGMEDAGLWPLLRYRWGEIKKLSVCSFHNNYYDK